MKFFVESQKIIPDGIQPRVVSNSQDFVACKFSFGDDWEELTKIALFHQGDNTYTQLLDEDGCCVLPAEIGVGRCGISVYGASANECTTATTDTYMVDVIRAGYYGEAIVPTPDLYSQLLATIDNLLKGEPGEDGVDGVDGADGKDGVDGVDGADGKDGIDGVDGRDGADGQDGLTTSITLNGELLTQVDGNIALGTVATEDYVTNAITTAIGTALGGSY